MTNRIDPRPQPPTTWTPCIEIDLITEIRQMTVFEYDHLQRLRHNQPMWAWKALPVEKLSSTPAGRDARIVDPAAYDRQMRVLLGIDPAPPPPPAPKVDPLEHRPCIEFRTLLGSIRPFTVAAYEDGRRRARHYGNPIALAFHELGWTVDAPPAEKLSTAWQGPKSAAFRISDRDAYDWQMQRLLGLR